MQQRALLVRCMNASERQPPHSVSRSPLSIFAIDCQQAVSMHAASCLLPQKRLFKTKSHLSASCNAEICLKWQGRIFILLFFQRHQTPPYLLSKKQVKKIKKISSFFHFAKCACKEARHDQPALYSFQLFGVFCLHATTCLSIRLGRTVKCPLPQSKVAQKKRKSHINGTHCLSASESVLHGSGPHCRTGFGHEKKSLKRSKSKSECQR